MVDHHPVYSFEGDKSDLRKNASSAIIRLRDVSKAFNSTKSRLEVLKNINYDILPGETIAVVGASGIGKSTLLNIIGTLDRPDSGQLLFHDKDIFTFSTEKMAEFRNKSIGFVFQFHHLLPEFTAMENVMMPLFIAGEDKATASHSAETILKKVGLKDRLSNRVSTLSGGEQQRVALARALVLKPPLLLADEPTGNLDVKNSLQVHELLLELNADLGMTLIVVTHNLELADQMGRRVTLIDGKLEDVV